MALDDLIGKAKGAASAALDKASTTSDALKDKLAALGDLSSYGGDKLRDLSESVDAAIPIITDAGYVLTSMKLELGVPPKVIFTASQTREVSDADIAALRERAAALMHGGALIGVFLKAVELANTVTLGSLKAREIEIEIGALPAARLIYQRAH
jgi:hypothetical protein